MAADGKGIDRHFFGLKQLLQPGEELPAIYQNKAFATASTWILSTSQLSSQYFLSWGFAKVVDDGFGLAYSVNDDSIRFCVNSTNGKARALVHYLQESAIEIRQLFEKVLVDESGLGRAGKL
jgi:carnitine O-acetyltransferase